MKKIFILMILFVFSNCTNNDSSSEPINENSINNLTLYNNITGFYYYSPNSQKNGYIRFFLEADRKVITQYTSHRETNQSDTKEEFIIAKTTIYKNYNNSNIDYLIYHTNNNLIILFSHKTGTEKYNFEKFSTINDVIYKDNFNNPEYYKLIKTN